MTSRWVAGLLSTSLIAGCVPIEESTPPPRTVATSQPRVETDAVSASGAWNRAPQRLESTSQFSLSLERTQSCVSTRTTETGGHEAVERHVAANSTTYHGAMYVLGGLGALGTVYASTQMAAGKMSFNEKQPDGSSKISKDGGGLIVSGVLSLLLIPAILASVKSRDGVRDTPIRRVEKTEAAACPKVAIGKHHVELRIGDGSLGIETDEAGQAAVSLAEALKAFGPELARHGGELPDTLPTSARIDDQDRSADVADKLRTGINWSTINERDRRMRAEETHTNKCNVFHTTQFEKVSAALFGPAGATLDPTGKVTLILTGSGADATVKLEHGGTYHTVVLGLGVEAVEFRDAHGDAITQPSSLLSSDGWGSESRQFIAGDNDAVRVRAGGEGCALLLVAREKPHAEPAPAPAAETDTEGRKLIHGPIEANGVLKHVHIVSDSIGVVHKGYQRLTIEDSVISAPICVRTPGSVGLTLINNTLDCDLGVQFETSVLMDNQFMDNRIRGQMQNIEF
jgi:hypothetical protein